MVHLRAMSLTILKSLLKPSDPCFPEPGQTMGAGCEFCRILCFGAGFSPSQAQDCSLNISNLKSPHQPKYHPANYFSASITFNHPQKATKKDPQTRAHFRHRSTQPLDQTSRPSHRKVRTPNLRPSPRRTKALKVDVAHELGDLGSLGDQITAHHVGDVGA